MNVIKSKWDGRNAYEARQEQLHLAPYIVLENLVSQLEVALNELEIRGSVDWRPEFGNIIMGDFETGEWHVFNELQAIVWQAKRAQQMLTDLEELKTEYQQRIQQLRIDITERMRRDKRTGFVYIVVAILPALFAVWVFSQRAMASVGQSTAVLMLAGLTLFFLLLAVLALLSSRQPNKAIQAQLELAKTNLEKCLTTIADTKRGLAELKAMYVQAKGTALLDN